MPVLWLLQCLSTAAMTGVIWVVQLTHYPTFRYVEAARFPAFARFHATSLTVIVLPLMLVEAATAAWLFAAGERSVPFLVSLALLGVCWLSTFLIQVPLHGRLAGSSEPAAVERLITTNWVRTVAWSGRLLLLAAATAPWQTPPRPTGDFIVATLNIWHDQANWPARRTVMLDALRRLNLDALFLQEVLQKEGLPNQAQQLADSLGWGYMFASVDPPDAAKRYGNAVLTRHRILATHEVKLPPLDDYRVAAHVRLELGGRGVDLYTTHLHHTGEGGGIREEQVEGLLAFIAATRGQGAIVLGGDFNAEPDQPELAALCQRFSDSYAAVHPDRGGLLVTTLNTALGHAARRIDHIFVEPTMLQPAAADIFLDVPSEQGVWASDHFGVWARLRWRQPRGAAVQLRHGQGPGGRAWRADLVHHRPAAQPRLAGGAGCAPGHGCCTDGWSLPACGSSSF